MTSYGAIGSTDSGQEEVQFRNPDDGKRERDPAIAARVERELADRRRDEQKDRPWTLCEKTLIVAAVVCVFLFVVDEVWGEQTGIWFACSHRNPFKKKVKPKTADQIIKELHTSLQSAKDQNLRR